MVVMTDSAALAERYGRRGPGRRPGRSNLVLAVAALAGLVLVAVTIWSFLVQADPDVRSTLRTYDVVSEHEVVASVAVVRKDEGVRATCRIHAVALDHSTVGRSELVVDSGPATQVLEVRIPTERKAVSVIRDGCTTSDQNRPR
jgi:hypothetical protein